jgi:N,N-dimethylformamidase
MDVVGYSDRLSVEPGGTITFMVSSRSAAFRAGLVRMWHGDDNPAGPGFKADVVPSAFDGEYEGRHQPIRTGSYVRVRGEPDLSRGMTVGMWILPTLELEEPQALLSAGGLTLALRGGRLTFGALALDVPLQLRTWSFVSASHDPATGRATLAARSRSELHGGPPQRTEGRVVAGPPGGELRIAADDGGHHFNGKIDAPRLFGRPIDAWHVEDAADPLARWDFSRDIPTSRVTDVVGDLHGETVNRPMRGATGHDWDGTEIAWPRAPQQYGAIHFHEDDLDDAGWEPTFSWQVPAGIPSGVYAAHLQAGDQEDFVPFTVRPALGAPGADIVVLLPTFSYLAYANEQLMAGEAGETLAAIDGFSIEYPVRPQDVYAVENRLLSLYDKHRDGSGVCFSSRMRPIVNMRPKYWLSPLNEGKGGPHQFNADMHLIDWLRETGHTVDVITDEDLYEDGHALLAPYRVVITGTHCEYWSGDMLDAARTYVERGGRLMYLGGNGMYWVTERDPERGHTVEIRRNGPSTRAWEPEPGEGYLSSTGELGGLWRHRGRAPQSWLGVGFTAQGNGQGRPYVRNPDVHPSAAWVFEGIPDEALIGDEPSLAITRGAAGFEVDRFDPALGSPARTHLLATASGFSDSYQLASEDVPISDSRQGGTVNDRVRADMTLLEYPGGGQVFSVGSIAWCACLSAGGYDNSVARVTGNVLRRFADG